MSEAKTTRDHAQIRKWAGESGGTLRIDSREPEEAFEQIDWYAFFRSSTAMDLRDGGMSRFNRFIDEA